METPQSQPLFSRLPRPWVPPVAAVGLLLVCLVLVWAVDVRGAFGGAQRLEEIGLDPPRIWFWLFVDNAPVEWAQWGLLAWFVVLSAMLAAIHRLTGGANCADAQLARFWTLAAAVGSLMLLEDAGNVRHMLTYFAGVASGFEPWMDTAVEIVWFGSIAGLGAYALFRHGRRLLTPSPVRTYGQAGVAFYGVAVSINATRTIGDWYAPAGRWLVDDALGAPVLTAIEGWDVWEVRFLFVDFLVEESLELLGASFMVAAVIAYARRLDTHDREPPIGQTAPGEPR